MSLLRMFARSSVRRLAPNARLSLQTLEAREVPAVDLLNIANSEFPSNKPLFVPVTAATADGPVTYSVTSSDSSKVTAEVVTGGRSLVFTVTGKDSANNPFTGTMTLRLFEDVAPLATQNIITLVKSGYYNNKEFHRVVNDFVIQGGSPNGDGQGGSSAVSDARDEYNAQYTFASRGIVAMANAGDDNNNAQFFITDPFIVSSGTEVDAPLDRRSQFLNFNHTILGILTSGFDTYQKVMDVPKQLGSDGAVSSPINDVKITSVEILEGEAIRDGVIKLTAQGGFLGAANITVTATQNTGSVDTDSKSFTVTSVADTVNDRPFLGSIANSSTAKNTAVNFTLPFTELDSGDTPTFVVGRVVNTANGPVFTTLDVAQGTASVDQDGRVTFTPATGFTGSVELTVGVRDAQDRIGSSLGLNDARNFDTEKITVSVAGSGTTNTSPTISDVANQNVVAGKSATVNFTVNDQETASANLALSVFSSNPSLLPESALVLGGSGAARTLTINAPAGKTGSTIITVTVRDGGNLITNDTFTLTITDASGNTAPTITAIDNQSTVTNSPKSVSFTLADAEALGTVTLSATSSNTSLLPVGSIVFEGTGASRTVRMTPASSATGTTTITITATDAGGLTATETFDLTVGNQTVTLNSTLDAVTTGRDVLFSAVVNGGTGSVQFLDGSTVLGTVPVIDNKALFSTNFATAGDRAITAKFIPTTGSAVTSSALSLDVNAASTTPVAIEAVGQLQGTLTKVVIKNSDGSTRHTVDPFPTFKGVITAKVGDVNGDGQDDVVCVPGFGGGPLIVVYDGASGNLIFQRMIFEDRFRGGLNLDVGDAKGLGYDQILVGAGVSGGPRVTLLDAKSNSVLLNYFAYENTNRGGVTVAISDLRGGNQANIITGAGQGISPTVKVFNPYTTSAFEAPRLFGSFLAGTESDKTGIRVGTGPLIGETRRDILVGPLDLSGRGELSLAYNPIDKGIFVG